MICSILDLRDGSVTRPTHCHLMRQNIFAINSAAVRAAFMAHDMAGSLGAGGSTGSSRFT